MNYDRNIIREMAPDKFVESAASLPLLCVRPDSYLVLLGPIQANGPDLILTACVISMIYPDDVSGR